MTVTVFLRPLRETTRSLMQSAATTWHSGGAVYPDAAVVCGGGVAVIECKDGRRITYPLSIVLRVEEQP